MSFTVGNLVSDVFAYWNRPSEASLSQMAVITIANRKINRLLLFAMLTDKNYMAVLSPAFTFTGREHSLTFLDDLSTVVRVESRTAGSTSDDNWSDEEIVDFGAWNDAKDRGIDAVAFYGSSPDNYSMVVNRDVDSLEFRIMYETGGVSLTAFGSTVPVFQDYFRSTIFYGMAAEAGMQLDDLNEAAERSRDKKVTYALAQEAQSVDDFKRWLLNEPGQSVVFRQAFNDGRAGGGQTRMHASDFNGGYYSRW